MWYIYKNWDVRRKDYELGRQKKRLRQKRLRQWEDGTSEERTSTMGRQKKGRRQRGGTSEEKTSTMGGWDVRRKDVDREVFVWLFVGC